MMMELAQQFDAPWPTLLILAGVIILGVLASIMIRDLVQARTQNMPAHEDSMAKACSLFEQSEQAQIRAESLIESAATWSEHFVEQTAILKQLLTDMDEKLASLERFEEMTRGDQPSQSTKQEQLASIQVTQAEPPALARVQDPRELDPLSKTVYERADAGRSPSDIAFELNEHIGKVELILALRAM